jgi:uncharacterized protein YyaL (SSP411 family)
VSALCHLQEATGHRQYLEAAVIIMENVIQYFSDTSSPYFFFTPVGQQDIIVRKKETYDGATPAGNSVMARNLLYLGTLMNKTGWKERAAAMLSGLHQTILKYPNSFGNWAMVLQWLTYGIDEIAVIGPEAHALSRSVLGAFIPNKVFQYSTDSDEAYPLLADKNTAGKTLIFACKEYACQLPAASLQELFTIL